MERPDQGKDGRLLRNQPYDESLEVSDAEEVASVYSPTPRGQRQSTSDYQTVTCVMMSLLSRADPVMSLCQSESRRSRGGRGLMSTNNDMNGDHKPQSGCKDLVAGRPGEEEDEEEEEDSDEEDTDDDDDDDDDEEEAGPAVEGAYDPADYANLPVKTEVKELFQYITRYTPQTMELSHRLKPFIPDFIPAVGDIDAFLKVPRPDGKTDGLGLMVLDEPSVKQSDPTVLSLWLSEESKQHTHTQVQKVTSVACPQSNPRAVDSWVDSIGALHRSKPPASVQYGRPMPDIDVLMQEWPPEVEELLGRLQLPSARLHCSLTQYVDTACALLDVPVYTSRIQALHLLFSLYLELRDLQHL